jgi:hypothetical protein
VTVVEDDTGIVSFLALQGEEVRLLYTRPDRIGLGAGTQLIEAAKSSGAGTQLIEAAKSSGVEKLELWCFQANGRARRFYEARGFHTIRCGERGADTRCPLSVGARIKLGSPKPPFCGENVIFVVFRASRSAAADLRDKIDLALGG